MTDPQKRDHWAALLSSMGITAPPEPEPKPAEPEASVPPAEPVVPQAAPIVAAVVPERPRPVRKPTDWGHLADSLGVTVPAPPPPRREPAPVKPQVVESSLPPAPFPEPVEVPGMEPERAEDDSADDLEELDNTAAEVWQSEMVELSDPLFLDGSVGESTPATSEASEDSTSGDQPSDSGESVTAERASGESEERRGRRRRRRRRKVRRGDRLPQEISQTESETADVDSSDESLETTPDAAEEADESDTERRRRRRGRKRRSADKPRRAEPDQPADAEPESDVDSWSGYNEGGLHDDELDEEEKAQLSHRAIPTWEQAIQIVIAKNLDARAKNPNGGQPRGRGGRRPRDRRN